MGLSGLRIGRLRRLCGSAKGKAQAASAPSAIDCPRQSNGAFPSTQTVALTLQQRRRYLRQFASSMPLPSMIALIVLSGRIRPGWCGTMTCFPAMAFAPVLVTAGRGGQRKAVPPNDRDHLVGVQPRGAGARGILALHCGT